MKWLVGASVYDVHQGEFSKRAIAVENGRIEGLESEPKPAPADDVVDLSGAYFALGYRLGNFGDVCG